MSEPWRWGSRFSIDTDALALTRIDGLDTRGCRPRRPGSCRGTVRSATVTSCAWSLRGDFYQTDGDPQTFEENGSNVTGRAIRARHCTWSWPWIGEVFGAVSRCSSPWPWRPRRAPARTATTTSPTRTARTSSSTTRACSTPAGFPGSIGSKAGPESPMASASAPTRGRHHQRHARPGLYVRPGSEFDPAHGLGHEAVRLCWSDRSHPGPLARSALSISSRQERSDSMSATRWKW